MVESWVVLCMSPNKTTILFLCLIVLPAKFRRTSYFVLCWFSQPLVKTDPLMPLSSNLTPHSHACIWFPNHTDRKTYSWCKDRELTDVCFLQRCTWICSPSRIAAFLCYTSNRLRCSRLHQLGKQHVMCLNSMEKGFASTDVLTTPL